MAGQSGNWPADPTLIEKILNLLQNYGNSATLGLGVPATGAVLGPITEGELSMDAVRRGMRKANEQLVINNERMPGTALTGNLAGAFIDAPEKLLVDTGRRLAPRAVKATTELMKKAPVLSRGVTGTLRGGIYGGVNAAAGGGSAQEIQDAVELGSLIGAPAEALSGFLSALRKGMGKAGKEMEEGAYGISTKALRQSAKERPSVTEMVDDELVTGLEKAFEYAKANGLLKETVVDTLQALADAKNTEAQTIIAALDIMDQAKFKGVGSWASNANQPRSMQYIGGVGTEATKRTNAFNQELSEVAKQRGRPGTQTWNDLYHIRKDLNKWTYDPGAVTNEGARISIAGDLGGYLRSNIDAAGNAGILSPEFAASASSADARYGMLKDLEDTILLMEKSKSGPMLPNSLGKHIGMYKVPLATAGLIGAGINASQDNELGTGASGLLALAPLVLSSRGNLIKGGRAMQAASSLLESAPEVGAIAERLAGSQMRETQAEDRLEEAQAAEEAANQTWKGSYDEPPSFVDETLNSLFGEVGGNQKKSRE